MLAPNVVLPRHTVSIFGVPLARLCSTEAVALVDQMIATGKPHFFVIADLEYLWKTIGNRERFHEVHGRAAFVLGSGLSLVSYSHLKLRPLPGSVTGIEMGELLCRRAAQAGHRVFLLSGGENVAQWAAENLVRRYRGLVIVGAETTPPRDWHGLEEINLIGRIKRAAPDLLLLGTGIRRGEPWLESHLEALGVPACVRVGREFFLQAIGSSGCTVPRWLERIGAGWVCRAAGWSMDQTGRVACTAAFLTRAALFDLLGLFSPRQWT